MRNGMWAGQRQHSAALAVLVLLLAGVLRVVGGAGSVYGHPLNVLVAFSVVVGVLHQVYVLVVWRLELYHSTISNRFGVTRGLYLFGTGFSLLFGLRFASVIAVAYAAQFTFIPGAVTQALSAIILLLFLYVSYAVLRYFGIRRAMGIDHFDPSYAENGLVRSGIFAHIANPMYTFSALVFLLPGLVLGSLPAVAVGAFHYAYIWVHYYTTERPDMKIIYGENGIT